MRRIGLLGGSFDPVHAGHLGIAEGARHLFSLDAVYFIPTGESYHKEPLTASREDRLAMLERALEGKEGFRVSTCDMERPGPTYTIDTLREMRLAEPEGMFFLIMGSDSFEGILQWKDIDEISQQAYFLVELRKGHQKERVQALIEAFPQYFEGKVLLYEWPVPDIRSTFMREGRWKKRDLPRGVLEYIREKGLYGQRS